ncbi:oxygenase MpaB family protein [Mycolicibacterium thermoresistibile]
MPTQYVTAEPGTAPRLTTEQTRIQITQRTPRWNRKKVDLTDALDFWSAAGAAANVIMQMSWPEVGYGVAESRVESGSLLKHPWKRLRTTAQYLAVAILGTDEQAENFYQSAMPIGTTLQVLEDQWPATRADFDVYWNTACERLQMDDFVREYLMTLVDLRMINPIFRITLAPLLRFLTIGFLAPVFREKMGFEWSDDDRRRFEHLFLFVSFFNRFFVPKFIRNMNYSLLMGDLRRRIRRKKALI